MARFRFEFDRKGEDGLTARQHLEFIAKKKKVPLATLTGEPKLLQAGQHIWNWYNQLSATRGGGFGPAPITYQEIRAWSKLMQTRPQPWEIDLIMMLDRIWFEMWADRDKAESAKRNRKNRTSKDDHSTRV